MNKIVLLGRLTRDPELRVVESGDRVYTKFIIAVSRNFKSADGTRKADFIPIIVWGKKAENICKYLRKGSLISLSGRLTMESYEDKNGNRKYITQVVANDFNFIDRNKERNDAENNTERKVAE